MEYTELILCKLGYKSVWHILFQNVSDWSKITQQDLDVLLLICNFGLRYSLNVTVSLSAPKKIELESL